MAEDPVMTAPMEFALEGTVAAVVVVESVLMQVNDRVHWQCQRADPMTLNGTLWWPWATMAVRSLNRAAAPTTISTMT